MKILIFSHEFSPKIGGAGVVAQEYASSLSKAGHDVTVLTKYRGDSSRSDCFEITRVKIMKFFWFFSYYNAIDFDVFDLIILNDVSATYTAGLLFNKKILKKSIVVFHGSEPETVFLKPSIKRKLILFKLSYLRAIKGCKNIISVSEFMKMKFINYTHLNHLKDKIFVIYNFVDHDVFLPNFDSNFRESIGVPEDAFLLVSVSRLVFGKGYLEKINIFEDIVNYNEKKIFWVIVGDGPDFKKIQEIVIEKKLNEKIIFLGAVSRNDLSKIYSSSNLFWLLSNYEESLGLVYIEAQTCGCPALGWNSFGVCEAILDGKSGYLVNNEDEIKKILLSDILLNIESDGVIEFLSRFHSNKLVSFIDNIDL